MSYVPVEELLNYIFIQCCVEELEKDRVSSASKKERINKLKAINKKFIEDKVKIILNEKE